MSRRSLLETQALYGLRTAPLAWNKHLNSTLTTVLGLRQCKTDCCLYIHDKLKLYLLVYVDDLLVVSCKQEHSDWLFTELGKHLLLKHTGTLSPGKTLKYLGRQLTHRGDNLLVRTLPDYVNTILDLYELRFAKPLTNTGNNLTKRPHDGDQELDNDARRLYRKAVGKLMWLSTIRPDITYATKELARGMAKIGRAHV